MRPVQGFSQQTPSSARFLLHGSIADGRESGVVKERNRLFYVRVLYSI